MFIGNYTGSHNGHKVAQNAVLNRKLRCLRGLKTRRTENRQEKMVTTQATCKTFKVASLSCQCAVCHVSEAVINILHGTPFRKMCQDILWTFTLFKYTVNLV